MKASLRTAVLALSAAGLAACAGTQEKSAYVSPGQVGSYPVDSAYVDYVNHMSRVYGSQVTWVNAPVRRVRGAEQEL